jgi:hypothetical protein
VDLFTAIEKSRPDLVVGAPGLRVVTRTAMELGYRSSLAIIYAFRTGMALARRPIFGRALRGPET